MKVRAFFNNNGMECRIEITHKDGHRQHLLFDSTSQLLGYCTKNGIELTVGDCQTEE